MRYKIVRLFRYDSGQSIMVTLPTNIVTAEPGDTLNVSADEENKYYRVPGRLDLYNYVTKKGAFNYNAKGKKTTKTDHYVIVLKETDPLFNIDLILAFVKESLPLSGARHGIRKAPYIYELLKNIIKKDKCKF